MFEGLSIKELKAIVKEMGFTKEEYRTSMTQPHPLTGETFTAEQIEQVLNELFSSEEKGPEEWRKSHDKN